MAPFSSAKPVVDSRSPALVAVGAVDPANGSNGIAFYSSQGPTNDGRIKPDVVGALVRAQHDLPGAELLQRHQRRVAGSGGNRGPAVRGRDWR